MESGVRETGDLGHATPIVVGFLRPFAEFATLCVGESEDPSSACVEPVARVLCSVS